MAKKILVIDDEPELVKALKIRLESEGYEVIAAYDGEEGIMKAREENPDLIVLDIMMPRMDGFTTLKELKKRYTKKNRPLPPVIVLTAKPKMQDLFATEGIKDYVVKPFEHQDLLDRIKHLLGGNGETKNE